MEYLNIIENEYTKYYFVKEIYEFLNSIFCNDYNICDKIVDYVRPAYIDATQKTLKKSKPEKDIDRTINYSIDSYGIKHRDYFYEKMNDKRLKEEKLFRQILESNLGHNVYRNPKPRSNYNKSADFYVKDSKETWDVKGIDGASKNIMENILSTACKKKQTQNLILHKRKTKYDIEILKNQLIDLFDKGKKTYIKKVMLFDENNILVLYLKREP